MSSIWGKNIKISLFGESHGNAVGVVIDGLPAGFCLDKEFIDSEMRRRAPGGSLTTPRRETDEYEILSGYFEEHTVGTPLCAIIRNNNTNSGDYSGLKVTPRPSHADYTGSIRYSGMNDIRGGGHFSARVTAGLVFAGSIAKQVLKSKNIYIGSHLKSIYDVDDIYFSEEHLNEECFEALASMRIPVLDNSKMQPMADAVSAVSQDGDSVGGVIEMAVIGLPAGLGDPFFDSVESSLSHVIFSIPGVKGIEFGAGFNICRLKGSQANDPFEIRLDKVVTKTNNNGGITGGITNGMPVILRTAMKPTPSISKKQETVNLETMENTFLEIKGRHDPCIAIRGVPVVEAAAAICILDMLSGKGPQ